MLLASSPTIKWILLLAAGWVILWWISAMIHKRFIEKGHLQMQQLLEDKVYYAYFCANGHYHGPEAPPPGTLCPACVQLGYIHATCSYNGPPHPAQLVSNTLPYQIECPTHGTHTMLVYFDKNRQISLDEWLTLQRATYIATPLPVDDRLSASLTAWAQAQDVALLTQPAVRRRIKNLEGVLENRLQALTKFMAHQERVSSRWMIVTLILGLLPLLFTCMHTTAPVEQLADPLVILFELPNAFLWGMKVMGGVLILFLLLLYILSHTKPTAQAAPRLRIRLALLLAEWLVLVVFSLIVRGWINPYEIMLGLATAVMVETLVNILDGIKVLHQLQQGETYFRDKLRDVRATLKNISEAMAFAATRG